MKLEEGIWCLPLRGRPAGTARLLDCVERFDPGARVVAVLGLEGPEVQEIVELLDERKVPYLLLEGDPNVVNSMNALFAGWPEEGFYGFLANDLTWDQPGTLARLAEVCPPTGLSYCDDGIQREYLATHPCLGGDLIRAQGWLMYPEAVHNGCDVYLMEMAHIFGGTVYCKDIRFNHHHHSRGLSELDSTYERIDSWKKEDALADARWLQTDRRATVMRIAEALCLKM